MSHACDTPKPEAKRHPLVGGGSCMAGYSPCLPIADDLDCADVPGAVKIMGRDPYGLDRDGDGIGCDS